MLRDLLGLQLRRDGVGGRHQHGGIGNGRVEGDGWVVHLGVGGLLREVIVLVGGLGAEGGGAVVEGVV